MLIACVVVLLSPVLHSLTTAGGVQIGALGAGLVLGAITLAIYLRAVRRAERDVERG
jgi:hypothetical protein